MQFANLNVKLFADGANQAELLALYENPLIQGFTTNPTLMRKSGVTDYRAFGRELLETIWDRPISFEVFSDDLEEMETQARELSSWGENVFVKIPVTNTKGVPTEPVVRRLADDGIKVNVTALMTVGQVEEVASWLNDSTPAYVSVFAGRIADTGVDPVPMMAEAVAILGDLSLVELIWASPRELLNIFQADAAGCHVITATNEILGKIALVGRDLLDYSLETVRMFHHDARAAGYELGSVAAREDASA